MFDFPIFVSVDITLCEIIYYKIQKEILYSCLNCSAKVGKI